MCQGESPDVGRFPASDPHDPVHRLAPRRCTRLAKAKERPSSLEGTLSQAVRTCDVRQAHSRGQANVPVQQVLTATALTLSRLHAWLIGHAQASTRQAACVRLATQ